ncbi:hypothetical protein ABZ746_11670 [Streptomyces sp. NPDC020096]
MSERNVERRLWLAVDMVGYGKLPDPEKAEAQAALRRLLDSAAQRTGLQMDTWDTQTAGDGQISAIPAAESEGKVVDEFVRHLWALLQNHNARALPDAHLRLRLAIDQGPYEKAPNGWGAHSPVFVSRLVDSRPIRESLTQTPTADLALILSDRVYQDVIATGSTTLNTRYFSRVEANGKSGEDAIPAWIWVPGSPAPPRTRIRNQIIILSAAALIAIIALLAYLLHGESPTLPTAQVYIHKIGPYQNGSTVTASLDTARPVSAPSTRQVRLTVTNHFPDQVLCVPHATVSTTVTKDGAQLARADLHNGDTLSVPLDAGQTAANLNLTVTSDPGCVVDLILDDVTSTK